MRETAVQNRKSRLRGFRNCALDGLVRAGGCGVRAISDRGGAGCVVLGRRGEPHSARVVQNLLVNKRIHPVYLYGLPLLMMGQLTIMYTSLHSLPVWMRIAYAIFGYVCL